MGSSYRRQCPDIVQKNQDLALDSTIYILRNVGPLGFYLKEDGGLKEHKVLLGSVHSCSCHAFQKDKELCRHICWVLLKRFRISKLDPISFQLGLTDRDIEDVVSGSGPKVIEAKNKSKNDDGTASLAGGSIVLRKEIQPEDVCPICQENLLEKHWPISYCRKGCGNNIHTRCMKIWSDHQIADAITSTEDAVRCPYCRGEFCTLAVLNQAYKHDPTRFIKHNSEINNLKSKTSKNITNDTDKNQIELLTPTKAQTNNNVMRLITTQTIPSGSRLVTDGYQCCLCLKNFQPRDVIGRLSCRHRFHKHCLTNWFMDNKPVCPIDGIPLITKCDVKIQPNNKPETLKKTQSKSDLNLLICGMPYGGETGVTSQLTPKCSLSSPSFGDIVDPKKFNERNNTECTKYKTRKVNFRKVNLQNYSRGLQRYDGKETLVEFSLAGTKLFQK